MNFSYLVTNNTLGDSQVTTKQSLTIVYYFYMNNFMKNILFKSVTKKGHF